VCCVVFFVLLVFILSVVLCFLVCWSWSCVLCCVFCFVCLDPEFCVLCCVFCFVGLDPEFCVLCCVGLDPEFCVLCCVFWFVGLHPVSCVPNVARISGLSNLDCSFLFFFRLFFFKANFRFKFVIFL
jgi:hypothetical protein